MNTLREIAEQDMHHSIPPCRDCSALNTDLKEMDKRIKSIEVNIIKLSEKVDEAMDKLESSKPRKIPTMLYPGQENTVFQRHQMHPYAGAAVGHVPNAQFQPPPAPSAAQYHLVPAFDQETFRERQ